MRGRDAGKAPAKGLLQCPCRFRCLKWKQDKENRRFCRGANPSSEGRSLEIWSIQPARMRSPLTTNQYECFQRELQRPSLTPLPSVPSILSDLAEPSHLQIHSKMAPGRRADQLYSSLAKPAATMRTPEIHHDRPKPTSNNPPGRPINNPVQTFLFTIRTPGQNRLISAFQASRT